ncbi:MAG: hypothetical protein KGD57_03365 [Candidatus Lokiarchaeota archaeon]|nr:hypothetical protein [Candidatus Lokiarchaeota archaeon]
MYLENAEKKNFFQKITIKKQFSNIEIGLYQYFLNKTGFFPKNIIIYNDFIFFFVENENFFSIYRHLPSIRREIKKKKILIIRDEKSLVKLLFSFFPDIYIHDIKIEKNKASNEIQAIICILSFEERGIAIGKDGKYIKAVNDIFNNYIYLQNGKVSIKIKCNLVYLDR